VSEQFDQSQLRVIASLHRLVFVPERDKLIAARGRNEFLSLAKGKSLSHPGMARHGRASQRRLFAPQFSWSRLAPILLLLVLLIGGTGATIYAAQDSLPQAPLYPVKVLSEDAYLALTPEPENKVDLLLTLADRRVAEMTQLYLHNLIPPESVTNRLDGELDEALVIISSMPDTSLKSSLGRVEVAIQRHREQLAGILGSVADPAKPTIQRVEGMLQERAGIVQQGRADSSSFRQNIKGRKGIVPNPVETSATLTPTGLRHPTPLPRSQDKRP
jgi:hypothetical protein